MEVPAEEPAVVEEVQSLPSIKEPHWQPIPPTQAPPTSPPVLQVGPLQDVSEAEMIASSQSSTDPGGPLLPEISKFERAEGQRLDYILMVGISGPPQSGKTTLSRLLIALLHQRIPVFSIAQDRYRVNPSLLVPHANGKYNRNCLEAYNMVAFKRLLKYVKDTGNLPPGYELSQELGTKKAVQAAGLETMSNMAATVAKSNVLDKVKGIGIVDGNLLYIDEEIRDILDLRICLRYSKDFVKARRFEKLGYGKSTTSEDQYWWRTSEYFEDTVWPSYKKHHEKLFQSKDVEGFPDERYCDRYDIQMQLQLDAPIHETLKWVLEVIAEEISRRLETRISTSHNEVSRTKIILSTVLDSLETIRRTIDYYILPADD